MRIPSGLPSNDGANDLLIATRTRALRDRRFTLCLLIEFVFAGLAWSGPSPCGIEKSTVVQVNATSYQLTAALFGIGVTLHNLEEAVFLASWNRAHLKWWFTPNSKIYWALTSLVSVVIWVAVVGVRVSPESTHWQCALAGFAMAMAINAVLPHFVISIVKRSYSPGAGTGMLLNLPLGILLVHEQLHAHVISTAQIWRQAVPYAALLGVGAYGSLLGAHAILNWKRQRRIHAS